MGTATLHLVAAPETPSSQSAERDHGARTSATVYDCAGISIRHSQHARCLLICDEVVAFTRLEYCIVRRLLEAFGSSVHLDELAVAAYGEAAGEVDERRIYRHINRIRPKLSPYSLSIWTIRPGRYGLVNEHAASVTDGVTNR